jgi:DNA-binding XRE family transcriptional regulator
MKLTFVPTSLREALDAAAHESTRAAVARGEQEMLTVEELLAALDAPTPLALWRGKRGLTQKRLGEAVGASQSYIADLESNRRKGDAALVKRLAQALRVRMEDIVVDAAPTTASNHAPVRR